MSGYKRATVTISEQEYRRLHETDMKRRFRGHKQTKSRDTVQTAELTQALQRMQDRQRELEEALGDLDRGFDQAGAQAMQDILTQNALYYESLATTMQEAANRHDDALAYMSQIFGERMDQEREQYRHNLDALARQLDVYNEGRQVKEQAARHWLRQAVVLADCIQTQFEHERFLPGRLPRIFRSLDLAQSNQAFLELSDLRIELEQRLLEWQTEYQRAYQAIRDVLAEVELNAKVNALGLQGEELPETVDVAYWTGGEYQRLLENCRHVLEALVHDQQSIPTEDLRRTHTEWRPQLMDRLESLVYEARLRALSSQLRMNIAERALQALENHGFTLDQSGYANDDMRQSFTAFLENGDGSQVTIEVVPTANASQQLANELIMTTDHARLKSEHEVRMQWQELCQSLNQDNLYVSRPEIRAFPPASIVERGEQPPRLEQPVVRSER
jgi:nitrate reductase assembly molybdenum cofactor insertion protein NarJ